MYRPPVISSGYPPPIIYPKNATKYIISQGYEHVNAVYLQQVSNLRGRLRERVAPEHLPIVDRMYRPLDAVLFDMSGNPAGLGVCLGKVLRMARDRSAWDSLIDATNRPVTHSASKTIHIHVNVRDFLL